MTLSDEELDILYRFSTQKDIPTSEVMETLKEYEHNTNVRRHVLAHPNIDKIMFEEAMSGWLPEEDVMFLLKNHSAPVEFLLSITSSEEALAIKKTPYSRMNVIAALNNPNLPVEVLIQYAFNSEINNSLRRAASSNPRFPVRQLILLAQEDLPVTVFASLCGNPKLPFDEMLSLAFNERNTKQAEIARDYIISERYNKLLDYVKAEYHVEVSDFTEEWVMKLLGW